MSPFGFSAGDIVVAIKIIWHIIKAFDTAKGAPKKYAISHGFLRQLLPVLQRIQAQVDGTKDKDVRQDYEDTSQNIFAAYSHFEHYLEKKHGLSSKEPSRVDRALSTISWALNELHEKVQKLRSEVSESMQPYQTLMLQEISSKISNLELDMQTSSQQDGDRFEEIKAMFTEVQKQTKLLHDTTVDYQVGLAEEQRDMQNTNTAAIRDDLKEIKVLQQKSMNEAKADVEALNERERELLQRQEELLALMTEQRDQARDQAEADKWAQLEAKSQQEKEASQQAHQHVTQNFQQTNQALQNVAGLTENDKLQHVTTKAGQVGESSESKWHISLYLSQSKDTGITNTAL